MTPSSFTSSSYRRTVLSVWSGASSRHSWRVTLSLSKIGWLLTRRFRLGAARMLKRVTASAIVESVNGRPRVLVWNIYDAELPGHWHGFLTNGEIR